MAAEHTARAAWRGDLMGGRGSFSLGSGAATDVELTWRARAEDASAGTSPEELLAAALASCFSMALAHGLAQAGTPPTRILTEATATFDRTDAGFRVTTIRLRVEGQAEDADDDSFREAAETAKENCPVSKALEGNVAIELETAELK